MMQPLPAPMAFRDAVSSLSPEQRRFAQAFRSMQLDGSVFAVCVVPLRPHLELLLGLPPNAVSQASVLRRVPAHWQAHPCVGRGRQLADI
jgi:hypothetical protein